VFHLPSYIGTRTKRTVALSIEHPSWFAWADLQGNTNAESVRRTTTHICLWLQLVFRLSRSLSWFTYILGFILICVS
jgi:hypothetical protein